jgi:hypothetical protein
MSGSKTTPSASKVIPGASPLQWDDAALANGAGSSHCGISRTGDQQRTMPIDCRGLERSTDVADAKQAGATVKIAAAPATAVPAAVEIPLGVDAVVVAGDRAALLAALPV